MWFANEEEYEKKEEFYPTIDGFISFTEAQEAVVFHTTNILDAGHDTTFMPNRIESIEVIITLLESYEKQAERLRKAFREKA